MSGAIHRIVPFKTLFTRRCIVLLVKEYPIYWARLFRRTDRSIANKCVRTPSTHRYKWAHIYQKTHLCKNIYKNTLIKKRLQKISPKHICKSIFSKTCTKTCYAAMLMEQKVDKKQVYKSSSSQTYTQKRAFTNAKRYKYNKNYCWYGLLTITVHLNNFENPGAFFVSTICKVCAWR